MEKLVLQPMCNDCIMLERDCICDPRVASLTSKITKLRTENDALIDANLEYKLKLTAATKQLNLYKICQICVTEKQSVAVTCGHVFCFQ